MKSDQIYIDPADVDVSLPWRAVDVTAIWEETLFPLIDGTQSLIELLERSVADWVASSPHVRPHRRRWRYGPDAHPPFLLTTHDGAHSFVDDAIEAAREAGCDDAHLHDAIWTVLCAEPSLVLPANAERILRAKALEIERTFHPQRETDPRWWRPMGSCQFFDLFWLAVATAWRPDLEWSIVEGEHHHTVVSHGAEHLIFDPLFLREEGGDELEPLFFALDDPRSTSRAAQRDCDELNARVRAHHHHTQETAQ